MNRWKRRYRDQAIAYERKLTEAQFRRVDTVTDGHAVMHEREHQLYQSSIDLAAENLRIRLDGLSDQTAEQRHVAGTHMTIERFEREHKLLADRIETALDRLNTKISAEERISTVQGGRDEATKAMLDAAATNRRWLTGLAIGTALSLAGIVITLFGLATHVVG